MLLREHLTFGQAQAIVEASDDAEHKKQLYLKGIFIQGDIRNFNERVYPEREIRRAVDSITDKLRSSDIFGELDHPEELTINLDRVSHNITEMWMDGKNGMGKLRVLTTPMGNIVRTIIESGLRLGVSSRGVGNVDDNGEVSGFELITIDCVASPSAKDAIPKPIYESYNSKRGRIIEDLAQAVSHDRAARKYLKEEMLGWISRLKY